MENKIIISSLRPMKFPGLKKKQQKLRTFFGGGGGFFFAFLSAAESRSVFFVSISLSTMKKWWHFSHFTKRVEAEKKQNEKHGLKIEEKVHFTAAFTSKLSLVQ